MLCQQRQLRSSHTCTFQLRPRGYTRASTHVDSCRASNLLHREIQESVLEWAHFSGLSPSQDPDVILSTHEWCTRCKSLACRSSIYTQSIRERHHRANAWGRCDRSGRAGFHPQSVERREKLLQKSDAARMKADVRKTTRHAFVFKALSCQRGGGGRESCRAHPSSRPRSQIPSLPAKTQAHRSSKKTTLPSM